LGWPVGLAGLKKITGSTLKKSIPAAKFLREVAP
jgi:hypothetical protein